MIINWVAAEGYNLDPAIDVESIKNIGPVWGSWSTWRSCSTDNVICSNRSKATDLIKRAFQKNCNFYIPEQFNQELGRPDGIKLFGGNFNEEVTSLDDIISMHLASQTGEIVLLLGFNFTPIIGPTQVFDQHKIKNYYGLTRSLFSAKTDIQWVLVDHPTKLDKHFQDLPNLTCDSLGNVLQLLAQ